MIILSWYIFCLSRIAKRFLMANLTAADRQMLWQFFIFPKLLLELLNAALEHLGEPGVRE